MTYKLRPILLLLLFSVPLFFLNIHNTHSGGGDDYAQYIKEAQNIAHGRPYYESNYVFNGYNSSYSPPQYPPGFPLLLSPVVKAFGIDIRPMCYFNTVMALCLMLGSYFYFKKYTGQVAAVCLSVIITYSGCLIDLKQAILSDGSSMLFVLLYLVLRNSKTFTWQRITVLVLLATMAVLVRTQSVLLLFGEVIYLCLWLIRTWVKEKRLSPKLVVSVPSLYIIGGCILVTIFLNKVVFYCPTSATGFYIDFLKITLRKGLPNIIRDNSGALIASITNFFHYDTNSGIRTVIVDLMESAGLTFCCIGFFISVTNRFSFDDIFFVLVCGLVLYYPIHDLRYFFPAMAIVFYYCYITLDRIIPAVTKIKKQHVGLALTVVYLFAGLKYLISTTQPPSGYVPEFKDRQAFDYISTHVKDNDIIVCSRPRLTTLYTNKRCMIHAWQYPMDVNKKVFDRMGVKYVLLNGIVDDYYKTYLHQYEHPVDSVAIAPGYTLYTLRQM